MGQGQSSWILVRVVRWVYVQGFDTILNTCSFSYIVFSFLFFFFFLFIFSYDITYHMFFFKKCTIDKIWSLCLLPSTFYLFACWCFITSAFTGYKIWLVHFLICSVRGSISLCHQEVSFFYFSIFYFYFTLDVNEISSLMFMQI